MNADRIENYRQVLYLHHLPLKAPMVLGDFILWPYYKSRDTFVKKPETRKYLDQLFSQMCDFQNRPLKHIAVLSSSTSPSFSPASKETFSKMNDVINALFFSAAMENDVLGAVSSDSFHLITQNFTPGEDGWGITDGSYIQITIGGLKLKNAGVRLSPRMTHISDFRYDSELLDGCIKCLMARDNSLRKQIFSSLQWVAYSYDNAPRISYHSRIIQLMVGFEILGAYPGAFTSRTFAEWLERTWNVPTDRKTFVAEKKGLGPYGPLGWWGIEFYKLRNDIIHNKKDSDALPVFDSQNREYFKTGIYVFSECMKEIFSQNGFFKRPSYSNMIRTWRLSKREKQDD